CSSCGLKTRVGTPALQTACTNLVIYASSNRPLLVCVSARRRASCRSAVRAVSAGRPLCAGGRPPNAFSAASEAQADHLLFAEVTGKPEVASPPASAVPAGGGAV